MAMFLLGSGVCVAATAASCVYSSSLDCRREGSVVVCELRKSYPAGFTSTDRFELNSAAVKTESYWLRGSSRSYKLLVLNSELEVPSTGNDPDDLAARLNELLDGQAVVTGTIALKRPSYGSAVMLSALAVLLSGVGALVLGILFFGRRRSSPAHD